MPGSTFHGLGRPTADPAAVLAASRAAFPGLAQVAEVAAIVEINRDYYEIQQHGTTPVRIRVRTGPLTGDVVAQTVRNNDGNYTLTISDRAADPTIERALAHEVAELAALHAATVALPVGPLNGGPVGPINPAGLTAHDRGRMAEVRVLAGAYAGAGPADRQAIRAELDALAAHLGVQSGQQDALLRWPLLPADVSMTLMRLTVPGITPADVSAVLSNPNPATGPESARFDDYQARLSAATSLTADQIGDRQRAMAVAAELAARQASMPRLPSHAGQIIGVPANLEAEIRRVDPLLADQVAREGVYVNLDGHFDLVAYTPPGPLVKVDANWPQHDLATPAGRKALLTEDRVAADASVRASSSHPAVNALLASHSFHYVGDQRAMMLVPNVLTETLAKLTLTEPAVVNESLPLGASTNETLVLADQVTFAITDLKYGVPTYGRPVDPATGLPVPLFNGTPAREQAGQGILGDCGIIASLGAIAGHRPELISRLLSPNPNGTVDVLLHEATTTAQGVSTPTGRRLRITVTPDVPVGSSFQGESYYARQLASGSSWASMLEKALAAVDRTWSDSDRVAWQTQWRIWNPPDPNAVAGTEDAAPTGYGRLNVGSVPQQQVEVLTQLTGETARVGYFDTTPGTEMTTLAELSRILAAGNPVLVSSMYEDDYPPALRANLPHGLKPGHVYELTAVRNGDVLLRNPWNQSHPTPMPMRAFLDLMYDDYAYLDAQPAPHPAPPALRSPSRTTPERPPNGSLKVARAGIHQAAGHIVIDELHDQRGFVYYAVLSSGGAVEGLTVVEISDAGQRSTRWTADPQAQGAGGSSPVTRPEAERIAAEVLGFALPDEDTLHEMLGG